MSSGSSSPPTTTPSVSFGGVDPATGAVDPVGTELGDAGDADAIGLVDGVDDATAAGLVDGAAHPVTMRIVSATRTGASRVISRS